MTYKRILTIQDISCVGQCSLTVALPILSACGLETAILPSAVLSTHTAGFKDFTFRDLTDDIPLIRKHWEKEGIKFSAIYTGYLGSTQQISYVNDIFNSLLLPDGLRIVDPAMADNGNLYPAFDLDYVAEMRHLAANAHIILPNITEASFLTGIEYADVYDEAYVDRLLQGLISMGCKEVVLTGVSYEPETTGVVVFDGKEKVYYKHEKIKDGCHGTGDVYASAFTGALMSGLSEAEAATIAADYVVCCIKNTQDDPDHFYGVKFEPMLPWLMERLKK